MKTLLIEPKALAGDLVEVDGDVYRHLFRAGRLAVGDALRLVDGEGHAREGVVRDVTRRDAVIAVGGELPDGEPVRWVDVWVPMPRPSRASWMVEKLTEVGAGAVSFYASRRAPRHSDERQVQRLERVAAAAVQQCGRSRLPTLTGGHDWQSMLESLPKEAHCLVLDPAAPEGLRVPGPDVRRVALLVGPEGGWTPEEVADLRQAGGRTVRLGPTILRLETAAVVGAAIVVQGV